MLLHWQIYGQVTYTATWQCPSELGDSELLKDLLIIYQIPRLSELHTCILHKLYLPPCYWGFSQYLEYEFNIRISPKKNVKILIDFIEYC